VKLTEYLNAINHNKEPLMKTDDESVEKEYVPFVVNRCLSYFPDTIYFVNEMNQYHMLPKNMQFDFLRLGVRKNKRYSSWLKKQKIDNIDIIKQYFGYSDAKAIQVAGLLTDEDLCSMQEEMYTGGTQKMKKPK
jgi:hypothetical protein